MIDVQAARLRSDLVARLMREDAGLSAGWRPAFERVPRHLFVPRIYQQTGRGVAPVLDESDPETWLAQVYSDEALVTRVHDQDHDTSLSSSSAPSVMWEMLDALEVEPGQRVLEIGTGTGYNAALLCERLGSEKVTSIDIDPELVRSARGHLQALGYTPALAVADGAGGYPPNAPYDRVLATCAVRRVPAAWIEQTRPGGLICTVMPYGMVRLQVEADGSAAGRFHPTSFAFMEMRSEEPVVEPLPVAAMFSLARGNGEARPTSAASAASVSLRAALWMVVRMVAVPDLVVLDLGNGMVGFLDRQSRSWARLEGDTVVEGGTRRIWTSIEAIYDQWRLAGKPDRSRIGVTVAADGRQHLWLDSPRSGCCWEL